MKKYILKSLFVSVLCMLAASCQDTEFAEAVDSSKAQVMFSIAMDSPAARSRANWGQDYSQTSDLGDEYDNRIDLDQFIVKIEAGGKTYNVTDIIKWKEGESNEHKFVGIVKTQNDENVGDITLQKAKISVYANMGADANANFASMTFDQDAENIPMWGALTVENLKFAPGKRTSVDDIYLLRAMAKFQVSLGDAAIEKGYTLTKASLNKFNLTGNNMPTGYAGAESTMALDMEGVLNENISKLVKGATELTEATEDGKGWVIYLPEISNTTASELKMLLTFSNGNNEKIETEVSVKDYTTANKDLVNIVRNHWYKYVIEDIVNAQPVVKYETLDWETININVGGEGFLALSTDLVEIYNANTGKLKFTSSSPITITRADVYEHKRNGEIVKRQKINDVDPVDAYYVNKFGVLTQLPTDESNPESVILANTSAVVDGEDSEVLNGSITINSPFIGDATATEALLKNDSHYDTIRYLEYIVTNEDGLSATFRVMQYPPVVITNVEGYFSYRDDHRVTDEEEPAHYHNFIGERSLLLTGISTYHKHDYTAEAKKDLEWHNTPVYFRDYGWLGDNCSQTEVWAELGYGAELSRPISFTGKKKEGKNVVTYNYVNEQYSGGYRETIRDRDHYDVDPQAIEAGKPEEYFVKIDNCKYFLRERFHNMPGWAEATMDDSGVAVGPYYKDGERFYRNHYTWNIQPVFWSSYVGGINDNGLATICNMFPGETEYIPYITYMNRNHRMYHIKTTLSSNEYSIGPVSLVDDEGKPTTDELVGTTANTRNNANIVSPSFMVASELGETSYETVKKTAIGAKKTIPDIGFFYEFAKRHCQQYVETTYQDLSNDGIWNEFEGKPEPVTHYHDWRLPTKQEIELIIDYQTQSRVMDRVLNGQYYFCVTGNGDKADPTEISNWVSDELENPTMTGYYIRCVRDVKPDGENGTIETPIK